MNRKSTANEIGSLTLDQLSYVLGRHIVRRLVLKPGSGQVVSEFMSVCDKLIKTVGSEDAHFFLSSSAAILKSRHGARGVSDSAYNVELWLANKTRPHGQKKPAMLDVEKRYVWKGAEPFSERKAYEAARKQMKRIKARGGPADEELRAVPSPAIYAALSAWAKVPLDKRDGRTAAMVVKLMKLAYAERLHAEKRSGTSGDGGSTPTLLGDISPR